MVDWESLAKLAGAITAGLVTFALGIQQAMKRWLSTSAETSVLSLLHEELERLAEQNSKLSEYVNKLQLEATRINLELGKLQLENQKLHAEVVSLTREVMRLRSALSVRNAEEEEIYGDNIDIDD